MTGRSVPEWRGSSPDAKIPAAVRARVFEAFGGRCAISGIKIAAGMAWDLDHIRALGLGGEHRETNLQPVLKDPHKQKTAADIGSMRKADRTRQKHLGIYPKSATPLRGRGFPKSRRARAAEAAEDGRP